MHIANLWLFFFGPSAQVNQGDAEFPSTDADGDGQVISHAVFYNAPRFKARPRRQPDFEFPRAPLPAFRSRGGAIFGVIDALGDGRLRFASEGDAILSTTESTGVGTLRLHSTGDARMSMRAVGIGTMRLSGVGDAHAYAMRVYGEGRVDRSLRDQIEEEDWLLLEVA